MSKLIQLKANKEKLGRLNELRDLLGLKNTYGEHPKTLDFGIDCSLQYIFWLENLIPELEPENLDRLFSSIKKLRRNKKARLMGSNLMKGRELNTSDG